MQYIPKLCQKDNFLQNARVLKICFPGKAIIVREQSKYAMSFNSNNRETPGLLISSRFKLGISENPINQINQNGLKN